MSQPSQPPTTPPQNLTQIHNDDDLKAIALQFKNYLYRRVANKEEIEKIVQGVLLDYKKEFQAAAALVAKLKIGRVLRGIEMLDALEKDLFDPKTLAYMTADNKIKLMATIGKSIDRDLDIIIKQSDTEVKSIDAQTPTLGPEGIPKLDPHQRRRVSRKVITILQTVSDQDDEDEDDVVEETNES
jgi:hypothetical protein